MGQLVLLGGVPLLTAPHGVPKIASGSVADCCCAYCCGFLAPVPDLVATLESDDCPFIDGLTFPLIFDSDELTPGELTCWRGAIIGSVGTDNECFQALYKLCCCSDNGRSCSSLCLTIDPSIAGGCILNLGSPYPIACTCEPFELLFEGVVGEVLPGVCMCCALGDVIRVRITL